MGGTVNLLGLDNKILLINSIVDILSKKYPDFFLIPEKKRVSEKEE
jgi:hypothetical protein